MDDRLARLEASHVRLMTEHEVFWKEHLEFVKSQDIAWARHQEFQRQYEEDRKESARRGADLDKRISDLVSGMGEFMRRAE